ncbi:MAG: YCF48-related protein [Bacteroidota bacterium]|jgi:photosystem II stability/assembly factor-like uncharacterized protein
MKKLLVISLIILLCTTQKSNCQSGWSHISTLTERHPYSVFFTNINTGYIAGGFGTGKIFKTTDGGYIWNETTFPCFSLHSVYFINSNLGWAVGASGSIYKTTNGGATWVSLTSGSTHALNSVYFVDENVGWIVGQKSTILKTTDGGTTWNPQTFGGTGVDHLYCVKFVDLEVGYAGGNVVAIKTTNSGLEWRSVTPPIFPVTSIFFINYEKGFTVGHSFISKTLDGGATWSSSSDYLTGLFSIYFVDANRGWICGNEGTILKTTDGGDTWITQRGGGSEYFLSIFFLNPLNGWVVDSDGGKVFKTTTGGTLGIEDNNYIPDRYILLQNYPNPFNPTTTIKFGLPEFSDVLITLYNILGEKVTEIYYKELSPGYHEKNLNVRNLTSGIYICSMGCKSKLSNKISYKNIKLVLMK